MRLAEAAVATGARLVGADGTFDAVVTDSRTVTGGELFVALTGARFDGQAFVATAADRGAVAAMISRPVAAPLPTLQVGDTVAALGRLAADWRARFDIPVLAVTGSNGKTTVKRMAGAILAGVGSGLVASGNLNNHIGLPLSLLALRSGHRFAVLEMGMNHAGEIDTLTHLAAPTVAVISNAAPAHLEGLGSVASVARAKGEIFAGLVAGGVAVLNADDPFAGLWRELAGPARVVTFGLQQPADVQGAVQPGGGGNRFRLRYAGDELVIQLPLPGRHNIVNALAAAAATLATGVTLAAVKAGLESITATPGRLAERAGWHGARVLDDSYNANPASVRAGIEVLAAQAGERIVVLGDMAELGPTAPALHAELGVYARAAGIDGLYALGPLMRQTVAAFGTGAQHCDDLEALLAALTPRLGPTVTVLVKGSRGMRMERVVRAITLAPEEH